MSKIKTVLGIKDANEMGITLPHEHLIINHQWATKQAGGVLNDVNLIIEELYEFVKYGGQTVVDATSCGLGRDPLAVKKIAEETGVNIVIGCSWYRESFYDKTIWEKSTNELADDIIKEINIGIGDTGVQAGIIGEIGSEDILNGRISPVEERVFRASARAQLATGVSIITHSLYTDIGLRHLSLLKEEGVSPHRVIIGHCGSYPHVDYYEALAEQGAYVLFDDIRNMNSYEVNQKIRFIKSLIDKGFLKNILLSHDICNTSMYYVNGGPGYAQILRNFVPAMKEAGITQEQVDMILIHNPCAALTGERD